MDPVWFPTYRLTADDCQDPGNQGAPIGQVHHWGLSLGLSARWGSSTHGQEDPKVAPGKHVLAKGLLVAAESQLESVGFFHLGARGGQGLQRQAQQHCGPEEVHGQGLSLHGHQVHQASVLSLLSLPGACHQREGWLH